MYFQICRDQSDFPSLPDAPMPCWKTRHKGSGEDDTRPILSSAWALGEIAWLCAYAVDPYVETLIMLIIHTSRLVILQKWLPILPRLLAALFPATDVGRGIVPVDMATAAACLIHNREVVTWRAVKSQIVTASTSLS